MNSLSEKARAKIEIERAEFQPKEPEILKPLAWAEVSAGRFQKEKPSEPKYVFEDILRRYIVGEILASGGTGKSYLLLTLAIILATGRNFSIFKSIGKFKILYIGAEDPEDELHRRSHSILENLGLLNNQDIETNLAIYSAMGKIEPIIAFDPNGNPLTTPYYDWLRKSIENLGGIDVLILDPMSRFFGLRENDNSDGTAWIRCLEKLALTYKINVLFAHHEPKSASKNNSLMDSTGRGAASIRDGCRWSISMRNMTEPDGKKFGVNQRDYIELDITKSNYSAHLPNSIFLKKGVNGTLEPANLNQARFQQITEIFVEEISQHDSVSRNDLKYNRGTAKEIMKNLKSSSSFTLEDIDKIINYALENGMIYEVEQPNSNGRPKKLLKVR